MFREGDSTYSVTRTQTIVASGDLHIGDERVGPVAMTLEREGYETSTPWRFAAHVVRAEHEERPFQSHVRGRVHFRGLTDRGRPIVLPDLKWTRQWAERLEGKAHRALFRADVLESVPDVQDVTVRLTPTSLALPELDMLTHSYRGEIGLLDESRDERPPVIVPTALGDARFALQYEWDRFKVAGEDGMLRRSSPTLRLTVAAEHRAADVESLLRAVADALVTPLAILSHLSRRHVRWTRLELLSRWMSGEAMHDYHESVSWQAVHASPATSDWRGRLTNPYRMAPEDIGAMVQKYESLPFRDSLAAGITYAVAAFDADSTEVSLAMAVTAFEAVVQGITKSNGSDLTLSRAQFDKLASALRKTIQEFASAKQLRDETTNELVSKVAEMQRRPIAVRGAEVIARLGVEWTDLYPRGTDLLAALKAAFRRRNDYLHAGRFPDRTQAYADTMRFLTLAERMVFAAVGGDRAWCDPTSTDHLRGVETIAAE